MSDGQYAKSSRTVKLNYQAVSERTSKPAVLLEDGKPQRLLTLLK